MSHLRIPEGTRLECRMLRLFFAQGIFAERSLQFAIGGDYEKKATDLDVLATEYGTGFRATRVNVESKSGKNVSKIDRILWLAGLRSLLHTEVSYFLVQEIDNDVAKFAEALKVNVFTERQLSIWEESSGLASSSWIGRSNYELYESVLLRWADLSRQGKGLDQDWLVLKEAQRFLRVDGWQHFSYANLNRLFRLAQDLSNLLKLTNDGHKKLCSRYYLGSLFVRFCQFLVHMCADLLSVPQTDFDRYIERKLIFGDSDSKSANVIVQQTLNWVTRVLELNHIVPPEQLDIRRLQTLPEFTEPLLVLVKRCFERPLIATNLPLTAELLMFSAADETKTETLTAAFNKSLGLAAQSRGFFCRLIELDSTELENISADLSSFYEIESNTRNISGEKLAELDVLVQTPKPANQAKQLGFFIQEDGTSLSPAPASEKDFTQFMMAIRPIADGDYHFQLFKDKILVSEKILANPELINEIYEATNNQVGAEVNVHADEGLLHQLGQMQLTESKLRHRDKLQFAKVWCEQFIQRSASAANVKLPYVQIVENGSRMTFMTKQQGKKKTISFTSDDLETGCTSATKRRELGQLLQNKFFASDSNG